MGEGGLAEPRAQTDGRGSLLAGKVTLYKGSLAQADILKFLAKNVKAVKAGWEEKVKPVLKEVKDAIAAQKRKAGACLARSCVPAVVSPPSLSLFPPSLPLMVPAPEAASGGAGLCERCRAE